MIDLSNDKLFLPLGEAIGMIMHPEYFDEYMEKFATVLDLVIVAHSVIDADRALAIIDVVRTAIESFDHPTGGEIVSLLDDAWEAAQEMAWKEMMKGGA